MHCSTKILILLIAVKILKYKFFRVQNENSEQILNCEYHKTLQLEVCNLHIEFTSMVKVISKEVTKGFTHANHI